MLLFGIGLTILLFGFFAGLEASFASANRFSIELRKKQGHLSGRVLSLLMEKPAKFQAMTYAGMAFSLTLFSLLTGRWVHAFRDQFPLLQEYFVLYIIVELLLSFILIALTYLFFTSFFRAKSNWLLSAFVRVIYFFYKLFSPVSDFFTRVAHWMMTYLFNVKVEDRKEQVVLHDLELFLKQGKDQEDTAVELNTELFENALLLPNKKVRECLVPRKEIIGVELSTPVRELQAKFIETKLSRMIIYEGNIDHIVGYVHHLDLFRKPLLVQEVLLPIPAVPESMGATDLITQFSKDRKSIAWVVDEFGGTSGIVTMEDLLEEIFGEIKDEYDVEEFVERKVSETEYIFSGRLELDYLTEKYKLMFDQETDAETLSGYVVEQHEQIPSAGEKIIYGNYEFEMLKVTDTRIEILKMKVLR
jgi:putative hemolysin